MSKKVLLQWVTYNVATYSETEYRSFGDYSVSRKIYMYVGTILLWSLAYLLMLEIGIHVRVRVG